MYFTSLLLQAGLLAGLLPAAETVGDNLAKKVLLDFVKERENIN